MLESPQYIDKPIAWKLLKDIAVQQFGDMVKAVVDVERKVMAIGAELHADAEQYLLEHGSEQKNLWGINIYVNEPLPQAIEFDSMINVRPSQGNRSRIVENPEVQKQIIAVVSSLLIA